MHRTGIIILAAGNSSRLGRPKQLLTFRGKTLLANVIAEARQASLDPAVVVTGAYHTEILESLKGQAGHAAKIVHNREWQTGMASGITAGLALALDSDPGLSAIIIAVCDQPHISADLFRALTVEYEVSGKELIASAYSDTLGTPVLFGSAYFKELLTLSGDTGAKGLLKRYPEDTAFVPFPKGAIDIDTEADLDSLQRAEEIR